MENNKCDDTGCQYIKGNNIDIDLKPDDCEIKADIVVGMAKKTVRIWGRVKDCDGKPIEGTLIKLVKQVISGSEDEYVGIAHTISDCEGFYQFDVDACDKNHQYKVIVSKSSTGKERVIAGGGNCHSCKKDKHVIYGCD